MVYTTDYQSPLGTIFLAADEKGLTGLWLEGQKYYAAQIKKEECRQEKTPVLKDAERWLDIYFQGKEPDFMPALHPVGTEFQSAVWEILRRIPYGRTITYGEIAGQLAAQRGVKKMSAQAVGGAVGHNKISIIIPCHRVVGSNGSLTGYAGGIDKKIALLKLEKTDMTGFLFRRRERHCRKKRKRFQKYALLILL